MDEHVAAALAGPGVAASVDSPAAAVGDRGELLDFNMDEVAGVVAHIAHRLVPRGLVAGVEVAQALAVEDLLHRGGRRADLGANPPSAASVAAAQLDASVALQVCLIYHICMASKTTINFDDEMEAALAELVAMDGTKKLAIKRSLLAEVKRRRRSQAMLDMIASWEGDAGPIDREHLEWADAVLDRQGVGR